MKQTWRRMLARFPYGGTERTEIVDWVASAALWAHKQPDIEGELKLWHINDTPVTMSRNRKRCGRPCSASDDARGDPRGRQRYDDDLRRRGDVRGVRREADRAGDGFDEFVRADGSRYAAAAVAARHDGDVGARMQACRVGLPVPAVKDTQRARPCVLALGVPPRDGL